MKKYFGNLRISAKLGLGFGLSLFLACAIGLTAWSGFSGMKGALADITEDALPGIQALGKFDAAVRQFRVLQYRVAGYTDQANLDKVKARMAEELGKADKALDDYAKTIHSEDDRQNFNELKQVWAAFLAKWTEIEPQIAADNPEKGFLQLEKETTPLFLPKVVPQLDKMVGTNDKTAATAKKRAEEVLAASIAKLLAAVVAAFIVTIFFGVSISRSITVPIAALLNRLSSVQNFCITDLKAGMVAFSQGDLTKSAKAVTTPVDANTNDELGQVGKSFNATLGMMQQTIDAYNEARISMTDLVSQVKDSSNSVSAASQILAASSEESTAAASEIAAGSEKLARSATECAAVMEELTAQASQLGDTSEQQQSQIVDASKSLKTAVTEIDEVSAAAENMATIAKSGNTAVAQTVEAMERVKERFAFSAEKVRELDEAGKKIGDIVQTIEDIAEQTNLLALNAAIEAARAGEQGCGFAVVAEEVRKLAEQAGGSTKEISKLITGVRETVDQTVAAINGTTVEVETGSERSLEAGEALGQIVAAAEKVLGQSKQVSTLTAKVNANMESVAFGSQENAKMVGEMTGGANQVAQSIQGVAAISEESAAGAEELSASIQEVGSAAGELAKTSSKLEELVSKFRYDEPSHNAHLKIAA